MPNMQLPRVADMNVIYKIREIMENNGFTSGKYQVVDGFPNESKLERGMIWPTIAVEIQLVFGKDVELGSEQWPALQISIDVLAKTDSQRDDIAYLIWRTMNEEIYTFYDFNSGFPVAVGNYAGITTNGDWSLDNMTITNLTPPNKTTVDGLQHHAFIDGLLHLPNINL